MKPKKQLKKDQPDGFMGLFLVQGLDFQTAAVI